MGIFGWSYPPGCSQNDVDRAGGVTPEAEAEEDFRENLWAVFAAHLGDEDAGAWNAVAEWAWKAVGDAYAKGYQQGEADAHLAHDEAGQ